jgi:hypothetical protein
VLDLVPQVPRPVWGRDQFGAGEMWNSNSVISWLLVTAGLDLAGIGPPTGGRAPGWHAGLTAAQPFLRGWPGQVGSREHGQAAAVGPHAYPPREGLGGDDQMPSIAAGPGPEATMPEGGTHVRAAH